MKKFIAFMLIFCFSFAVFASSAEKSNVVKAKTELSQVAIVNLESTIFADTNSIIFIITEQSFGFVPKDTSVTIEVEARCNSPTISSRLS